MAYIDRVDYVVLANKVYKNFPIILNNEHIVNRLTLKYFLSHRVLWSKDTFLTYSKHICDFFSQLEVENPESSFDHIDDDWLEAYADQILHRNQNTPVYVSQLLSSIIHFLIWCESRDYCKNLIGTEPSFKIRIISTQHSFTHKLIQYYSKQKSQLKLAPKEQWVEKILAVEHFKSKNLETRFSLMVDWGKEAGLRAHEICALDIKQIPTRDIIEQSMIDEKNLYIELVVTKGMKKNTIPVTPMLLKKTRDYMDFEREEIIKKHRQKARLERKAYIPPTEIFLSLKTGQSLHPRTLSNQIKSSWHQAVESGELKENQRVWTHGLRHLFATNTLKDISEVKKFRDPQQVAKLLTRHKHASTLDIYTARIYLGDMDD